MRQRDATTISIPAPIGGEYARGALQEAPENTALRLENFVARPSSIDLRRGYIPHLVTGLSTSPVKTLIPHYDTSGTGALLACANGKIYDVTTFEGTATELGTGFTQNEWSFVTLDGTTVMCNGVNQPQKYTTGGGLSSTTFTGVTDDELQQVTSYRGRLYFVRGSSLWYGSDGGISGALTEFPVGKILQKGGGIAFATTTTSTSGAGREDSLIIVSNNGEVLLYEGAYPGDSSWTIRARLFLPPPMSRRSFFRFGSDVALITRGGLFPLSSLFSQAETGSYSLAAQSAPILDYWLDSTSKFEGTWEGLEFSDGDLLIISYPITATASRQWIVNARTNAWSRWSGINAGAWCVFNNDLYFGGLDGKVYKAWEGYSDNTNRISWKLQTAYVTGGSKQVRKRWNSMSPIMQVGADLVCNVGYSIDYSKLFETYQTQFEGSGGEFWDLFDWDTTGWASEASFVATARGLNGIGYSAALELSGATKDISISIVGFNVDVQGAQ